MIVYRFRGNWTRQIAIDNPDKVFLFGDNLADAASGYVPSMTQAVIRGLPNAIGIPTKRTRRTDASAYFTDADFTEFCGYVDSAINRAVNSGLAIVIPYDGIGTGRAQLPERAPRCYQYLRSQLNWLCLSRENQ